MPRRRTIDERAVTAAAVSGIIRVSVLEHLGVPRQTIARRCGSRGRWQRVLPGVVALQSGELTRRQRLRAALAYAGDGAMVTGAAACLLYGIRLPIHPDQVHLLVPASRQPSSCGFTLVERTTRLPVPEFVVGIRCAPAVRAVLDVCRRLARLDDARSVIASAVQHGHCQVGDLVDELECGSDHGSAGPHVALREIADGVRSVAEARARLLLRRCRLPAVRWNARIVDRAGRYLATPDCWFDEVALAWEIDSVAYHLSPADYTRTVDRDARLAAAGITVFRTLPARLHDDPAGVCRDLTAAHRQAALRPRPPVHIDHSHGP